MPGPISNEPSAHIPCRIEFTTSKREFERWHHVADYLPEPPFRTSP